MKLADCLTWLQICLQQLIQEVPEQNYDWKFYCLFGSCCSLFVFGWAISHLVQEARTIAQITFQ